MIFKRFFFATLGGTIGSAVLGISLAYAGAGAWALVAQYLANSFCDTLILWITVKWRPQQSFSLKRMKELLDFGWKMLGSQLIHVIYNKLSTFVIGTVYSTADLAYYEQGTKIPGIVETNIDTTINSVLFPAMSKSQDDLERLKQMVRRSIRTSAMVVWPLMIGLLAVAEKTVAFIYTEKWLPCVIFMQIACLRLALEPVQTANLQAVKALGRSDLYIMMESLKKGVGIIILLISSRISIIAISIGTLVQAIFCLAVNGIPNKKILGYGYAEQLQDVAPYAILSGAMGICVSMLGKIIPNTLSAFILQIAFGIVLYVIMLIVFRKNDFMYIMGIIKSFTREAKR